MPGKNLKELAGIPLVAHAIRRAQGAARILGGEHRIVVSTDSPEIGGVALTWGAEVLMRTPRCSGDVKIEQVMDEVAEGIESFVLVQPTSPLATAEDVAACARAFNASGIRARTVNERTGESNGAAYAMNALALDFKGGIAVPMPASRSIDVDTQDDWNMAEAMLAARPVAGFPLGTPGRCFVIAEAGVNHDGDAGKAHRLIDAAADAGADAVKFQTFVPSLLAEAGPHQDMLAKLCLAMGDWRPLKRHAEQRGLVFLSSPFDMVSVEALDYLDVPAFKVPSGEITNEPLLRHIASKGKPVILSTGMSTMREVAAAVDALAGVPLALLHCVSEYPAKPVDANLRAMDTLRMAFGLPVGWSDHTVARLPSVVAVARGACIVEKHLTLDTKAAGPDHAASTDPEGFRRMVRGIRLTESALGNGVKVPTPGEGRTAAIARRKDGLRRAS